MSHWGPISAHGTNRFLGMPLKVANGVKADIIGSL